MVRHLTVNQGYSGSIPDSSVMGKFFIKVDKDDEVRVKKVLNVVDVQFSKCMDKETGNLIFSVYCNVMEQKSIFAILKDWNVLYEVVNVN